ncbi:hypothetical protein CCMA1212_000437 [Trichoderma ghanense]|uniref:SSCRP protein n=1 Tax=Trichoderma ghanense TaxID=65468 RepID=A0ABY2HEZ3_9HYPO
MISVPRMAGTGDAPNERAAPRAFKILPLRWVDGIFSSPMDRVPSGSAELPAVGNTCDASGEAMRRTYNHGAQVSNHRWKMRQKSSATILILVASAQILAAEQGLFAHVLSGKDLVAQNIPEEHIDWRGSHQVETSSPAVHDGQHLTNYYYNSPGPD